ncbi:N-acetylmuramoyl-L-alanine amidase [Ruminococcus sp.]|uniref:N-acetylmuramoyl-L-alanine amidase n=1 Tax=Ruminococcus sp. TaxID=41978 RepID=UPI0025E04A0E|nr:N-acetylmuramoyl-L-alanine amidase [Ruminococcus sp.]MCI6616142.1 N-acetylmuramoyl-L-alanine amidase [Ruminococcus sp.]
MKIKKFIFPCVCFALLSAFVFLMISAALKIKVSVSSESVKTMPTIVIDAGHGGEDGGAVSDSGVLEKDINLSIANDTSALFYMLGFDVTQTRITDIALDNGEDTIRKRKVSDMKKRLEIFNSSEENTVISIHQNKFSEIKYHGTQIFYSPNNPKSKLLADSIKYSVKGLLQPDNERECKKADSGIYLLKNTNNPAVIVECGFISNGEECKNLLDSQYQKQMAYSITAGFLSYYNTD